ncbi:MAG TPA: hypothetical protein VE645_19070 [Pseudonocardiaceae bacterium]|jgi:hypothetical protein|nr:hypothetical protein [Pseudonocardiaceae bacterium]
MPIHLLALIVGATTVTLNGVLLLALLLLILLVILRLAGIL